VSITEEQLTEWERVESAALPGPWVADIDDGWCWTGKFDVGDQATDEGGTWCTYDDDGPGGPRTKATLASVRFIEAARTAVPALIAEVRRLRVLTGCTYGGHEPHCGGCCVEESNRIDTELSEVTRQRDEAIAKISEARNDEENPPVSEAVQNLFDLIVEVLAEGGDLGEIRDAVYLQRGSL
jgi:hypothetical protein